MTVNLLQVRGTLDQHLGAGINHRKEGEISYFCPFCNHYKQKLQVNLVTQKWHCWVCDSRGLSIATLLKKSNAPYEVVKAIRGVYGDNTALKHSFGRELVGLPENYKPLHIKQNTPDYRNALHYVMNVRKLTPIDILKYQIGYCEDGPYAGMIIIPSYDDNCSINYYVGRSYYSDSKVKHKNPPVTKDVIGFENQINWNEPIVLVEGAFDAISTKRNAIPLFGKAIHPTLKGKILRHAKKLYVALDRDAFVDSLNYVEYFMNNGIEVYIVNLPGKDPNDLGYKTMVNCIQSAEKMDFLKLMMIKLNM